MLRLILRTWRHRRGRVALLLAGALAMGWGLGLLTALGEMAAAQIHDISAAHWRSSYDILVRPTGAPSELEAALDLVEPNALIGLPGGITVAQWEEIRALQGVEVAAPIANLGVAMLGLAIDWTPMKEPGIYRVRWSTQRDDGLGGEPAPPAQYYVSTDQAFTGPAVGGLIRASSWDNNISTYMLYYVPISAIDPAEEARLVGLDGAVISGRYLAQDEQARAHSSGGYWDVPVLASVLPYVRMTLGVKVERVDLPVGTGPQAIRAGGRANLDRLPGTLVFEGGMSPEAFQRWMLDQLTQGKLRVAMPLMPVPGSTRYRVLDDPQLLSEWPTVLAAVPEGAVAWSRDPPAGMIVWRSPHPDLAPPAPDLMQRPGIWPRIAGLYDPARLRMALDPLNQVPTETYRPPTALIRLDATGRPVEPPKTLLPTDPAYGLVAAPPILLTTIGVAEQILGEAPIAAIRIKVRGVDEAGEISWQRLEWLAREITRRTGLVAEITAGASPRRVLVQVPGWQGPAKPMGGEGEAVALRIPPVGYVELPWVQKGAGITLIREARVGFNALLAAVVAVGSLFALTTAAASAEGWRREAGLLAALGLRPAAVGWLLIGEAMLFGLAAGAAGLALVGVRSGWTRPGAVGWALLLGLPVLIFGAGALPAALRLARHAPGAALRSTGTDDATPRTRAGPTVAGLVLASLWRRPARNVAAVLALGVPGGLLGMLGYISLHLDGRLFITRLGQQIALEVKPLHYEAAVVALVLAALVAVDVIAVKVAERGAELALLGALGVPARAVQAAVVAEGGVLGLAGGALGALAASTALFLVYGRLPDGLAAVWTVACAVPGLCGLLAALAPARMALRVAPALGMRTE